MHYRDRIDAGQQLAEKLMMYANRPDVLVLALPRGGVPVGFVVAEMLHAPLDVFLVRKLGVPGHEELAMGAIASGGVTVVNRQIVEHLGVSTARLREVVRREQTYRRGRPAHPVRGREVILVDDGLATGSTMRAALRALRARQP